MNDNDMETLEQWQSARMLDAALLASFMVCCDVTLRGLEKEADNLTDQVKRPDGVKHLRQNWPRFKAAFTKLQDIYVDMTRIQERK